MTLTELLISLVDSHEITGAFDSEGVLQDTYLSFYAKREITRWYLEQGELLGEATAGHEKQISDGWADQGDFRLGLIVSDLCKKQALEWLKNSDAWRNAETELQQRFDYGTKPESTFREDTFRALDPTR